MIGPVSGTGRTMMASLQQAMSKGMPPDQAIQYVKSMATQGVAPLADLYAMMKQFERLKQQPVQPPQTPPTIRDELNMMEQQQMMGGMPPQMMGAGPQMPGGGGGPQMPPQMPQQMPPQMTQGLGAINAGAMENPSFAGGGIVAFQTGGMSTTNFVNPNQRLNYLQEYYGLGGDETDFINRQMAQEDELAQKYGLGKYGEAAKTRRQQIEELQKDVDKERAEGRRMDTAEFFFNIAAAAAKPGATFLGAVAEAGPSFAKATRATKERMQTLQAKAREANLRILEAEELAKAGNVSAARKLRSEGVNMAIETGQSIWENQEQTKRAIEMAREQRKPVGVDAERAELAAIMRRMPTGSPEYIEAEKKYNALTTQIAAAQARKSINTEPYMKAKYTAAQRRVTDTQGFSDTDPRRIEALRELQALEAYLEKEGFDLGPDVGGAAPAGATDGDWKDL